MNRYLVSYTYVEFEYDYGEGLYSSQTEGKQIVNEKSKARAIDLIAAKGDWITNIKAQFLRPGKSQKKAIRKIYVEPIDLPF